MYLCDHVESELGDLLYYRPDLIEFHKLIRSNATHNLQQAFNIAEQNLGLTKLLDPEGKTAQRIEIADRQPPQQFMDIW